MNVLALCFFFQNLTLHETLICDTCVKTEKEILTGQRMFVLMSTLKGKKVLI